MKPALWIVLAALWFPALASAHAKPLSYSAWVLSGEWADVELQMTSEDLATLGAGSTPAELDSFATELPRWLELRDEYGVCTAVVKPHQLPSATPWTVWHWTLQCHGSSGIHTLDLPMFSKLTSDHRHLARVELPGEAAIDRLFTATQQTWSVRPAAERRGSSITDYIRLGVEHLYTGADHILFVLALLLVATRLGALAWLVTSFTLAHSVTLALTILGWVVPRAAPVETLIAFSVALLGAENVWSGAGKSALLPTAVVAALLAAAVWVRGPVPSLTWLALALFCAFHFSLLCTTEPHTSARAVVSFAFGLIHGFGFASVMGELKLPEAQVGRALLGFNLGIELGQLGIVLTGWLLLSNPLLRRHPRLLAHIRDFGSAAISGTGIYWMVQRML